MSRSIPTLLTCLAVVASTTGCTSMKTTGTARTAKEQLLVSNSIDQALEKVDFTPFAGQGVFIEEKYLDCVDKNYVIGSLRHRTLRSGASLVPSADNADIILEARSGGVGTNLSDTFLGIPEIAVPGPLPVAIPEIKLLSRTSQTGIAKIGLVAYEASTGQQLGGGGVTLARSSDNNWFVMGVGPYQNGSIRREVSTSVGFRGARDALPTQVAFSESPQPTQVPGAMHADAPRPRPRKKPNRFSFTNFLD